MDIISPVYGYKLVYKEYFKFNGFTFLLTRPLSFSSSKYFQFYVSATKIYWHRNTLIKPLAMDDFEYSNEGNYSSKASHRYIVDSSFWTKY